MTLEDGRSAPMTRGFKLWLVVLFGAALGIGVIAGHAYMNPLSGGDDTYFHVQADLLADGHWFKHPFTFLFENGRLVDSAIHPPAFTILLAVGSLAGFGTYADHVYLGCVVAAFAVVVIALVGRRLVGERAGIIAGVLAAVYPNIWLHATAGMSESLYLLLIAAIVLLALDAWAAPTARRALVLGVLVGIAVLTRGEALALIPLLLVPTFVRPSARRWTHTATAVGVSLAVILPWSAWNSIRFGEPVLVSVNSMEVIALANCPYTYSGPDIGHWTPACYIGDPHGNEAERGRYWQQKGINYMRDDIGRLPVVTLARLGGTLGVYRPVQHVDYGAGEGRNRTWGLVGMVMYWLLAPAAIAGAVLVHRAGRPLWPVLAPVLMVLIVTATVYGSIRFRVAAEPSIVVLAAVSIDRLIGRLRD